MSDKPICQFFQFGLLASFFLSVSALAFAQPPTTDPPKPEGQNEPDPPPDDSGDDDELPKYEDMEVPSVKQLLLESPVDWIRLKVTDEVIVVEPVYPRPNTLKKMEEQMEELSKTQPPDWRKKRAALNFLNVVVKGETEAPEFRIETKKIEEIIYHEELLLRRVDLLIKEGDQRKAFELLYQLERRLPNWPGLEDRKNFLVFAQAESYRQKKEFEPALVFYEQLFDRKPDYPELSARLGDVTDNLIANAADSENYRRSRHFLGRLRRLEKSHPIVEKWEQDLEDRASKVLMRSRNATAAGKHDEAAILAKEAISIWPNTPNLRPEYLQAWRRFQTLRAGVMQLANKPSPFFLETAADQRQQELIRSTLFSVSQAGGSPRYHSRYIEQWDPQDLGRKAIFRVKSGRADWEARPETTAADIAVTLNHLLDPGHEEYSERLSSYIDSISVKSPTRLEVNFSRVPLRTEALLNFPLRRSAFEAEEYQGPARLADIHSEAFRPIEETADFTRYRRAIPEPDDNKEFHVAEIQEHLYDSHLDAIQDLRRGKLDMIAGARIWHVDAMIDSNEFFVLKHNLPRVHVLQFNPKSQPLRNREFRRALVHSIDKKRILFEDILRKSDFRHGRLITAPFDQSNYAYNRLLEPHDYDLVLAVALRLASQNALGGSIPTLKMVCDPDPPIVAAAQSMVDNWKRVGIPVELIKPDSGTTVPQDSDAWDIVYRTTVMPEPLTELWPFFTMQPKARISDLAHLPDWLRLELIALDTANDWNSAIGQLRRIQKLLLAEVQLIPLWEVDEYSIYRRHLEGFRREAMHPYQDVDQWTVGAWIPPETP